MKCKTYNTVAEMATVIKKELDAVEGYGREFASATVCCRDEMATRFTQEFIKLGYKIAMIELDADEFSDYDKEYYVTVGNDGKLFVEKAYVEDSKYTGYITDASEIAYVHESCNSAILNELDISNTTEFSIREFGDDEYFDDNDYEDACYLSHLPGVMCEEHTEAICSEYDADGYYYSYSYPDDKYGKISISVYTDRQLPKSKILEIMDALIKI